MITDAHPENLILSLFDWLLYGWRHKQGRTPLEEDDDLFGDDFLRKLETLALTSRKAAAGTRRGERRGKKKGSGVEFADHRSYVPGDDIRFLDLGIYRRFGKLLIRVYEEEEDLSLYFLIDCSASMGAGDGGKLRQAKRIAAALGYIGLSNLDRVSVLSLTDRIAARLPPTRGRGRFFRILKFLSGLQAKEKTDLEAALRTFVAQHRRRGLAVLITDLYDPRGFEAGINVLRFNRFDVCVMHIVSKDDATIGQQGDLTVIDIETGEAREVTVTQGLEQAMRQAVEHHVNRVEKFCAGRGIPYFAIDKETPFDEVVLRVLRRGGLLK